MLLCACQPTPEQEIVIQKDFDRMIEKAKQTPAADSVTEEGNGSGDGTGEAMRGAAPEIQHVAESFTGRSEHFKVEIDADVIVPEGPIPILRVKPSEFNPENLQPYYEALTKGEDFYLKRLGSREYLENMIAGMQEELDAGLPSMDRDGVSEQEIQNEFEAWREEIEKLKKLWQEATDGPGEPVLRLSDVSWEDIPTYLGWELQTQDDQGLFTFRRNAEVHEGDHVIPYIQSSVYYENRNKEPDTKSHQFRRFADVTGETEIPNGTGRKLSPEKAQTEAERLIETIGIRDMEADRVYLMQERVLDGGYEGTTVNDKLPADYTYQYVYEVRFCRAVNGLHVTMPTFYGSSSEQSETAYAPVWAYEELYVRIGDGGVCAFWYQAPLEVTDTVVENANLKPFSDILDIAKKMLPIIHEEKLNAPYNRRETTFTIDRITLSLQRIAEKDNLNYGLLTPVWCFWGTDSYVTADGSVEWNDVAGNYGDPCGYLPLLCINAVDGSIIDPQNGY
jgi:hypothetical protein